MKRILPVVALLLVVACGNQTAAGTGPSGPVIEIASEFPLVGPYSFPQIDGAIDVAIRQHPTVDGYRLVHVTLDDSLAGFWNEDRMIQNIRRAVGESAIAAVIGPWTSQQAQFLIPQTAPAGLAVISPSNTLDCLTDPAAPCLAYPRPPNAPVNYFRVAARDSRSAQAAADFAVRKLGISRFAVFTNPVAMTAPPLSAAFAGEVVAAGGAVVYRHDLDPLAESFAPLLRDAYAAGAQAIYMTAGIGAVQACGIRKEMKGIFPASTYVLSDDRLADNGCIADAGLVGTSDDHLVLTIATGQPASIPVTLQGLKSGNGYPIYTFSAYDCAQIVIDSIDRAIRANGGKIPTREEVRQEIASTSNFRGITGTYSFDANGDVVNPSFSFYTVKQGSWAFWRNP